MISFRFLDLVGTDLQTVHNCSLCSWQLLWSPRAWAACKHRPAMLCWRLESNTCRIVSWGSHCLSWLPGNCLACHFWTRLSPSRISKGRFLCREVVLKHNSQYQLLQLLHAVSFRGLGFEVPSALVVPGFSFSGCNAQDRNFKKCSRCCNTNLSALSVCSAPSREMQSIEQVWATVSKWVCLKIGYIPNYSHLIGIMIINHWV